MSFYASVQAEIKKSLDGNHAFVHYPGIYDSEIEDYDISSIALDGRFTLIQLEKIVSILRTVEKLNT
jgi:hypothetical protein